RLVAALLRGEHRRRVERRRLVEQFVEQGPVTAVDEPQPLGDDAWGIRRGQRDHLRRSRGAVPGTGRSGPTIAEPAVTPTWRSPTARTGRGSNRSACPAGPAR